MIKTVEDLKRNIKEGTVLKRVSSAIGKPLEELMVRKVQGNGFQLNDSFLYYKGNDRFGTIKILDSENFIVVDNKTKETISQFKIIKF